MIELASLSQDATLSVLLDQVHHLVVIITRGFLATSEPVVELPVIARCVDKCIILIQLCGRKLREVFIGKGTQQQTILQHAPLPVNQTRQSIRCDSSTYLLWYSSLALFTSTASLTRGLYSGTHILSVSALLDEYFPAIEVSTGAMDLLRVLWTPKALSKLQDTLIFILYKLCTSLHYKFRWAWPFHAHLHAHLIPHVNFYQAFIGLARLIVMAQYKGAASEGNRAANLLKQRERAKEELERMKMKIAEV